MKKQKQKWIFKIILVLIWVDFGLLPNAVCLVNFFKARPKLKVVGGYF